MPAQRNVRTDIGDIAYKVNFKTTVLVSVSREGGFDMYDLILTQ